MIKIPRRQASKRDIFRKLTYSMIAKLDDEFNSRKKEACLAKQKDHYGFQIRKNDINTRVEMRKSNHFTPYIQQQRV